MSKVGVGVVSGGVVSEEDIQAALDELDVAFERWLEDYAEGLL